MKRNNKTALRQAQGGGEHSRTTALITGASGGIGREIAQGLAKRGYRLALAYRSNKRAAERLAEACARLGAPEAFIVHCDIRNERSIRRAARKTVRRFGRVSALINNAGVNVMKPLRMQSFREIDMQLETNLGGLIKFTKVRLPFIGGAIINIASRAGKIAKPSMTVYCATKFGVRGFTQSLAQEELALRVLSVNPDRVATRMVGFRGRPPRDVARVVADLLDGKRTAASGTDIDLWKVLRDTKSR